MGKLFELHSADLFCGGGGTSEGLKLAAAELGIAIKLTAINHWDVAITTHTANHPDATHYCERMDNVDPKKLVPSGRLGLLVASPECTNHSRARGGVPINDQSRASAWHVCRWAEALYIEDILIENVPEFVQWGPLGANGKPLKSKKGETFRAFIVSLESLGYRVAWKVLNAADYGGATTRERLFIMARRGNVAIAWPEPSHSKVGGNQGDLFGDKLPWRPAREIIDWTLEGKSIFTRKKPLAPNTMKRIEAGIRKFWGKNAESFIMRLNRPGDPSRSVADPLVTVTAQSSDFGLVEPFIVQFNGNRERDAGRAHSLNDPLGTVTAGGNRFGLVEAAELDPFLAPLRGEREGQQPRTHSIDEPLPTATTRDGIGIVEPFVVILRNNQTAHGLDVPVPTITTSGAHLALVEPFIVAVNHGKDDARSYPLDEPMKTVTSVDAWGIVEGASDLQPFVLGQQSCAAARSVDDPLPTVAAAGAISVVEPFLTKFYGTGLANSVDDPLDTVTARDRFGLVTQDGYTLDIRFRMLQPHELAAAQGFPMDYEFHGTREQKVKQIGNAVEVNMAKALCMALLKSRHQPERCSRKAAA